MSKSAFTPEIPQPVVDACFEAWSNHHAGMTIDQRIREVLGAAKVGAMCEALEEVLRDTHMNAGYVTGGTLTRIRAVLAQVGL
jgi:hypothetical protein